VEDYVSGFETVVVGVDEGRIVGRIDEVLIVHAVRIAKLDFGVCDL
jgi:hypothetical protein